MLTLAYVVQAAALAATAASLLAGAPALLSYALAACAATAVTLTRPAQAALVPALARTPEELTASNVVSGWIESISLVAAPAATGVLLAVGSPGLVFAVMAGLSLAGGIVVAPVAGPPPAAAGEHGPLRALRLVREEPEARLLLGLLAAESVAIGALDVRLRRARGLAARPRRLRRGLPERSVRSGRRARDRGDGRARGPQRD